MPAHYSQSNRFVKPGNLAVQRLGKWLLVPGVLAGTVWLLAGAFIPSGPVAPAAPTDVGAPVAPPSELFSPPPHYPANPQFLAAAPGPAARAVLTGRYFVL